MEAFDRHSDSERRSASPDPSVSEAVERTRHPMRSHTPKSYRFCDELSGGLICFMVVFTPWAFGTTQEWSIWTMNVTGVILGALLAAKWLIQRQTGYRHPRWDVPPQPAEPELIRITDQRSDRLAIALAGLTVFILAYTLVSALNSRATYLEWAQRFEYRDCINWLPHSYDSTSTWKVFWMYLGLACFFWATRHWLLGKSSRERRRRHESEQKRVVHLPEAHTAEPSASVRPSFARTREDHSDDSRNEHSPDKLPARLQLLMWVLCINGSLLALEAILQRLSGTNKLLWVITPRINSEAILQFGPYAYRANAASYFNLVWPVCLGFWLVLRRSAKSSLRSGHRFGSGSYLVLLPGAVLMAACPIISTARGGAIVAVITLLPAMGLLLWSARKERLWFKVGASALFAVILGLAALLGLKDIAPRFQTIFTDRMSRRTEIYDNALLIARDFPILGTGPGTFGSLYQLYRISPDQHWAAYVHDDWLETRITFGWVGFGAIVLMLGIVLARWFWRAGFDVLREFTMMIWIAVGGCLLHGKFDFPLQIYSILFLFLLLCVILFSTSRRKPGLS
jgi:hypothetical protein